MSEATEILQYLLHALLGQLGLDDILRTPLDLSPMSLLNLGPVDLGVLQY